MFLKRIEILGFKSFADRTIIEFSEGISALLGPNGCGKSNIVDAIKWVLGEQSVRNMRAERMDDVIFSGTENRKALSVAEVTLVIANDQGLLEIDHSEIAIKRRIFREGDSEYFLNATPVRLKEIRELFFDTGIGKSAYSVMEQGRIDQVLSNKPEERRFIFEEAAGITKSRVRGSEAERKLSKTEENMIQVENILHEVSRNYENLKKQTGKTLEYRKLKDDVFGLDRDLKLLQWRDLITAKTKKSEKLASRGNKHLLVSEKITILKTTLANELDSVNDMESRLIESQKKLYGTDLEKENQEEQIKNIRERRHESGEICKSARIREKNAVESLGALHALKKNREDDLASFQDRLKEIEGNISTLQKIIATAEMRSERNADETVQVNDNLATEEQLRESLQDDLRTLTDDIVSQLDRGLKDSGYDHNVRRKLELSIMESLAEMRIRSEGRWKLLADQKNLSDDSTTIELLEGALKDFSRLSTSLEKILKLFTEYRDSEAAFLEDFLAPEGIITRKRDLDEKIVSSTGKTRGFKEQLVTLATEKTVLTAQINDSRKSLEELRVAQARTTTQTTATEDSLASLDREAESEETRLREIRQQLIAEETRIRNLEAQVAGILTKREELEKTQAKLRKDMAGLEAGISSENKKMTGCENRLKRFTEQRGELDVEKERIRLEIEYLDNEIKLLLEDFRDRNSCALDEFLDLRESITLSPKQIRNTLHSTRAELKNLGQVNLMAPEEFKEVAERHNFLSKQLDDLKKAREHLALVTEEIRKESATLFLRTFKEVREHFHEMFRRLFGGGRAEIRMLDPDDPLNSGLEIYAQPPGKKLENISLLSGGEKSLCGVALMFATFQVKPSPFCILDEIDAALDEANIQRFVNLLTEFGKKSQFIVITHNKKTVSGANTLLGMTMQESGVSRLITMRLNKQEEDNEKNPRSH